jgi:hypothetical protein
MGIYRKIDSRIWNDEKFRKLGDDGQFAFIFVVTHPAMTCLGAMRASLDGLANERRWKPRRFRDAITDGIRLGMVEVNEAAAYVGVPNFLKYNAPEGPNSVTKAWIRALDMVPECPERHELIHRCRLHLESKSIEFKARIKQPIWDAFPLAIRDAIPDGQEHASPIQNTEGRSSTEAEGRSMGKPPCGAPAAAWAIGLPLWVERELQSLGISEKSARVLLLKAGADGIAPALAKIRKGNKTQNAAGLLLARGEELSQEGKAMLAKALEQARSKAPGALEDAVWVNLPWCLRDDPEVACAWCEWKAAEVALSQAGENGQSELRPMENSARAFFVELALVRHPKGKEVEAKADAAVASLPAAIRLKAWAGAVVAEFRKEGPGGR